MKTEDVRMYETALGPFSTLILFSVPERAKAANEVQAKSMVNAPAFAEATRQQPTWHDRNRRAVFVPAI